MPREKLIELVKKSVKTERKNQTKKLPSKREVFEITMEKLENEKDGSVEANLRVLELEKTRVFSRLKAREYLDKEYNSGRIYQPKPGLFQRIE